MSERNFFAELKRRNVYRVAVAYAVAAWLLVQIATQVFPFFEIPNWAVRLVVVLLALGFPVALVLAWAFELTPEGIKRSDEVTAADSIRSRRGRKLIGFTAVAAAIAAGLFSFQWMRAHSHSPLESGAPATPPPDGHAGDRPSIEKSIAVLPFENLSSDKENAYFAEGVQDEILTRLARVAELKVISRTSTQKYKSAPDNLREIAKQLGVMHLVEGSVQRSNNQVRVNVQLINAISDAHLWADTYDRKLTDIFAVESEIAKTIAETLQAKLSGPETMMMSKRPTESPEAYELYLKGRFFWNKRTEPDLRKSIEYFNQAIAKDPNFALAYAGLSQSWLIIPAYNGGAPKEACPQAEAAARKALAIDNTLSEAVATLAANKAMYEFDFAGSLQEYERAIRLNPNVATTHHWLAVDTFANTGQHDRELAEMKRALELDPLSLVLQTNLGNAYLHLGRLDEAVAEFRKAIELDGSFYFAQWSNGIALEMQGKMPDAIAQYEKAARITDDPLIQGLLGRAYGLTGRKEEARRILENLRQLRTQRYTAAYILALVYIGLDDKIEAVNWLEQGYQERDGNSLAGIRIDPLLAPLRGDARFEALAERVVPASQFHGPAK